MAIQDILKNWFMLLHESVSFFGKEDYEKLHALLEPAQAELVAMQELLNASRPFAEDAEKIFPETPDDLKLHLVFTCGQIRRLAEALAKTEGR